MMLQRDAFIEPIHMAALHDKDIVFLSADFGAQALDGLRRDCPDQFIHCGISEQHMIDMAAGLALAGKKVYCYAMGPFLSLRAYEQIKGSLATMGLPVTLISTGVGLGYADSGPTHYLTEDIACLRALNGVEILTPADALSAAEMALLSLKTPGLRYIRLDREALPTVALAGEGSTSSERQLPDRGFHYSPGHDVCILSCGYMLYRVNTAVERLVDLQPSVVDLFRIKPLDFDQLGPILERHKGIVTVEEQCLSGGFGSAVVEAMSDHGLSKPTIRMGLPDRYYFENGGRGVLLDAFGLSVEDIATAVMDLA